MRPGVRRGCDAYSAIEWQLSRLADRRGRRPGGRDLLRRPLLIVAFATTGLGAALAAPTLGAAVAVVGMVAGGWWLAHGRGRVARNSGRSQEEMHDD